MVKNNFLHPIKNFAKKSLLIALSSVLIATGFPSHLFAQENKEAMRIVEVQECEEGKEAPKFIGSIYGEGGEYYKTFDEHPMLLNTLLGYNILDGNKKDGVLLFPTLRIIAKGNKSEFFWDNYIDTGLGVSYIKKPFIIGAEGVHREAFERKGIKGREGDFFRLWGGYWNRREAKPFSDSKTFPMQFSTIQYAEADFNTLTDNLCMDARQELDLDVLDIKGFKIGPYAAAKINYDTANEPWYRYGHIEGGLQIRKQVGKGVFKIFAGSGYRESFNKGGLEGRVDAVYAGFWFPLEFGKSNPKK